MIVAVQMRPVGRHISAVFVLVVAILSQSAAASTILAQTDFFKDLGGAPGYVTIDVATGATTSFGLISGAGSPSHYAYDPNTSTLYGFDSGNLITLKSEGAPFEFGFGIPTTSLVATTIGPVGVSRLDGLAFDTLGNRLLAVDRDRRLLEIDSTSGASTVIAQIDSVVFDLGFDPRINRLVGTRKRDGFAPDLMSIDPVTGASTHITAFIAEDGVRGVAFDPSANALVVMTHKGRTRFGLVASGKLFSVDTVNGTSMVIAPVDPSVYAIHAEFDFDFLPRITIVPDSFFVPEPSTLMSGLFVASVLGLRRDASRKRL